MCRRLSGTASSEQRRSDVHGADGGERLLDPIPDLIRDYIRDGGVVNGRWDPAIRPVVDALHGAAQVYAGSCDVSGSLMERSTLAWQPIGS